jgi:hypothetical protein
MRIRYGFVIVILFMGAIAWADRPSRKPAAHEMEGDWVGYGMTLPYFYRLHLEPGGKGTLVGLVSETNATMYSVVWRIENRQLLLTTSPLNEVSEPIRCSVNELRFIYIMVVFSGLTNNWSQEVTLLNTGSLSNNIDITGGFLPKQIGSTQNGTK